MMASRISTVEGEPIMANSPSNSKVAIVTGAAQGIGKALAEQLAARGAILGLIDKRAERLAATAEELRAHTEVSSFHVDVRDAAGVEEATRQVWDARGRLDYFFNNAGLGILGEARDHEIADWREVIDTNLYGTVHGICAAYPRMIAQGHGHIVNIGSLAGAIPVPGNIAYVASKSGVMNLTLALRPEAALHGVRVTLVTPMAVSTPMLSESKSLNLNADVVRKELVGPAISAVTCARTILRGVDHNRAVVRPHLASLVWQVHHFLPWLLGVFYRRAARKLAQLRHPPPPDRAVRV
jgi:short-subunit dehydrogenase